MRFLALVSGIVYILLNRPAPAPSPVRTPPQLRRAERELRVRLERDAVVRDLLDAEDLALEHEFRRKDDRAPLQQACQLLHEVATPLLRRSEDAVAPDPVELSWQLTVILSTIKKHFGLAPEADSMGAVLLHALQDEDIERVDRWYATLRRDIRGISDDDRSHYLFFLFWPRRYSLLMRGVH